MRIALIAVLGGLVASSALAQARQPTPQSGRVSAYTAIGDPREGPSFRRPEAPAVRKDGKKCRLRNGGKVCLTPERWSAIDSRRGRWQAGTR